MPKFLENRLRREYAAKGKSGKALDRAIYGTLNKIGAMRGSKTTAKGRRMQEKHERHQTMRRKKGKDTETNYYA